MIDAQTVPAVPVPVPIQKVEVAIGQDPLSMVNYVWKLTQDFIDQCKGMDWRYAFTICALHSAPNWKKWAIATAVIEIGNTLRNKSECLHTRE